MKSPSLMPKTAADAVREQIALIGNKHDFSQFPSLRVFWENWTVLHKKFLKKLECFGVESANLQASLENEIQKLLRKRQAFLSSALQFFHAAGVKKTQEARIFSSLISESDKVFLTALNEEIARLRRLFSQSMRSSQVIRAYTGHGQRTQLR